MSGLIISALVAGAGYFSYRYAWWRGAIDYKFPRILMYHMVREHISGSKYNGLRVKPSEFEKQIKYLKENGWTSYTMSELVEKKDNLPQKSVAITFDDGYLDNLTNALPILKKYNFKATIYVVNNRFDNDWSRLRKAKNSSGELVKEPKLSDDDIQELIDSGLVEIGVHTMNHKNFKELNHEETKKEIEQSKKEFESRFQIECKSFAYPFGFFKENDDLLVKSLGFTNATTTKKGVDDLKVANLFLLKRITVSGRENFLAFKIKMKSAKRGFRG